MDKPSDEQSAPYVCARTGPQLSLIHVFAVLGALIGAVMGCKYGLHHGGVLFAFGGAVTGFLIGGVTCLPIVFLLLLVANIPEFIRAVVHWISR